MRAKSLYTSVLIALFVMLLNCTPKAEQVAGPTPTPRTVAPAAPTPAGRVTTPEEAAWDKVVQASKKEGNLTLYATWTPEGALAIKNYFQNEYPWIEVNIINGRGTSFTERLKTEKRINQRVGDFTQGSATNLNSMKLDGLLTSVVDELPALREKGVWLVEPTSLDPQGKANLSLRFTERSSYINTKLVKTGDVPQTWKDLLGPRWVGNMGTANALTQSGPTESAVVLIENKVWDENYIRALHKQKLQQPPSETDVLRLLATGEIQLTIMTADAFSGVFAMEGAPIQAISIEGISVVTTPTGAVIDGAPHPNTARVFMNWLFTVEGQLAVGKAMGNKMLRKDVPDFRPKAIQAPATKYLITTLEDMDKATTLLRQGWLDKLAKN